MKFNPDDCTLDFHGTIKISKGENTFPYITFLEVDKYYYYLICHEKGKLPSKEDLLQPKGVIRGNKGTWEILNFREGWKIREAFYHYENMVGRGLIPFSFLVGACAVQGVDLFDYVD